jgi:hypothetical protein
MNRHSSFTAARVPLSGGNTAGAPLVPANNGAPATSYGHQPICPGCNRGAYTSCLCDPFYGEGEPDYAAEERVSQSLKQIDWCKKSRGKLDGFERIEL